MNDVVTTQRRDDPPERARDVTTRPSPAVLLASRVLLAVGALGAVVAIAVLVADAAVRGYRSGPSTDLALAGAGVGVVLGLGGVALARRRPRALDLPAAAVAVVVLGVVAAAVLVLAVPAPVLLRGVTYDVADSTPDLVLHVPDGIADGELLVATVYHRGPDALRVPGGWVPLRTTALPGPDPGTLTVLTRTGAAGDAGTPVTFSGAAPGTSAGGITTFAGAGRADVAAEGGGAGGTPAVPATAGRASAPAVAVVATSGVVDLRPSGDTTVVWRASVDGLGKGTLALLSRPAGTAGPMTVDAVPAPVGWAAQTLDVQPG